MLPKNIVSDAPSSGYALASVSLAHLQRQHLMNIPVASRREFLFLSAAGLAALPSMSWPAFGGEAGSILPMGGAPEPLDAAWFPSRMHAFVWRNWALVPLERMAEVVGAKAEELGDPRAQSWAWKRRAG